MARDSSGNYTLPSGNPVVSGTTIESTWANNTMEDIGTTLQDSLSRSGKGAMTAPIKLPDGTASLPAITFNDQTNTGLYRVADDNIGITIGGVSKYELTAAGLLASSIRFEDGGSQLSNYVAETEFTPSYTAGVSTPEYSNRSGQYHRIGDMVFIFINISTNGGTTAFNSSALVIDGLPFTPARTTALNVGYSSAWDSLHSPQSATIDTAGSIRLYAANSNGTPLIGTDAQDISDGAHVIISGVVPV